MAGVDISAHLGNTFWTEADAVALAHARQRARFDLMFISSLQAAHGDLKAGNAAIRALVEADEQTRGWLSVSPGHPQTSAEEMRRHLGSAKFVGARLVGAAALDSEPTRDLLNALRRYGKPISVAIGDAGRVRELDAVAPDFKTMKFIAEGAGGSDWQHCMLLARRVTNIFLEPFTGGAQAGKLAAILEVVNAHRVLFATGYPLQNPGIALGLLADADIPDTDRQAILTRSAQRVFELPR